MRHGQFGRSYTYEQRMMAEILYHMHEIRESAAHYGGKRNRLQLRYRRRLVIVFGMHCSYRGVMRRSRRLQHIQ